MSLTLETTVIVSENLAVADLGDEAVLLDPASGSYFGLNEVAARILHLTQEETTVSAVVDRLVEEFDVSRERLTADVLAFVADLESRGLIVTS